MMASDCVNALAVVHQRGHAALRIHLAVGRGELFAAVLHEVHRVQAYGSDLRLSAMRTRYDAELRQKL